MTDFDPAAFDRLTVLPPERLRHHLGRFYVGLGEALQEDFRIDPLEASNLVTQAHVLGFESLATSLAQAFGFEEAPAGERPVEAARLAIERARPKVAEVQGLVGKDRLMQHIIGERGGLMDQAQMFATGDAYRVETRDGRLEDVSEERLNIILDQVHDIDEIINDPDGDSKA